MLRRLLICTAAAVLAGSVPAWAGSPLDEYQQTGHITPCRYSASQLNVTVPNDVAQYAPDYESALQAAARRRAAGCARASGGSSGPGPTAPRASGSSHTAGVGSHRAHASAAPGARRTHASALPGAPADATLPVVQTAPSARMAGSEGLPARMWLLAALPLLALLGVFAFRRGYPPATSRRRKTR